MYMVSCIDLEPIIIVAFLGKDTLKRCNRDTGIPNANSTGTSKRPSNVKQFKALHEWLTFSFTPSAVKVGCVVNLETLPLTFNLAIFVIL